MDKLFGYINCADIMQVELLNNEAYSIGEPLHSVIGNNAANIMIAASSKAIKWEGDGLSILMIGYAIRMIDGDSSLGGEELLKDWAGKYRNDFIRGLGMLQGSFYFVLVDHDNDECIVAIDRMGTRPLAYAEVNGGLVFGSSCDLVKKHPAVTTNINPQGIFDYLYFHVIPSPGTIYKGINKLEPAQYIRFKKGKINRDYFWKPGFVDKSSASYDELAHELKQKLDQSVQRCGLDSETGAFLSGGLDSSTVAGVAKNIYQKSFPTYSIGFDAEGYDEMEYARIASNHFKTEPREYYVTPADVLDVIPRIAKTYDEPFGNSSAIPVYFCAQLAKKHGTNVLLAGDGGDELFAGNARYAEQKIFEYYLNIPSVLRKKIIEPLVGILPSRNELSFISKLKRYVHDANILLPRRLERYNFLQRTPMEKIFTDEFSEQIDPEKPLQLLETTYKRADTKSVLNRMLYLDWKQTLADNDLRKVTHMSGLAGVDVRYPMLDDELVEFSMKVPAGLKLKGSKLRYFYKNAISSFLPDEIINKKKHGFGLPFGVWLKEVPELQEIAYASLSQFAGRNIIKPSFIDWLIEQHNSTHAAYYGEMVWVIMMLELWLQNHTS